MFNACLCVVLLFSFVCFFTVYTGWGTKTTLKQIARNVHAGANGRRHPKVDSRGVFVTDVTDLHVRSQQTFLIFSLAVVKLESVFSIGTRV